MLQSPQPPPIEALLVDLINDYLAVIIGQIRHQGGEVSDIKGDSVMAFWASRSDDQAIRAAACRAVIEIDRAVGTWNADNRYGVQLPTRIGLHCAPLAHEEIGTTPKGTVRFSIGPFNTESDIDALIAAVTDAYENGIT